MEPCQLSNLIDCSCPDHCVSVFYVPNVARFNNQPFSHLLPKFFPFFGHNLMFESKSAMVTNYICVKN